MRLHASFLLSLLTLALTTASPAPDLYERDPSPDLAAGDPSPPPSIPLNQERDFTPDLHSNHERDSAALPNLNAREALPSPVPPAAITPAPDPAPPVPTTPPPRRTVWNKGFRIIIENKKDPKALKIGNIQCLGPYGRIFCQKWCYCDKTTENAGKIMCNKKVDSFRKGDRAIKDIHALSLRGFCGPVCSCLVNSDVRFGPLELAEWNQLKAALDSLHPDLDNTGDWEDA